jgi:transcriptional regulator with XRE-family HTH domain
MKKLKNIEFDDTSLFDKILDETPVHEKILFQMSIDVATQIMDILEEKGMRQKDLAERLGKTEAEVSKWMSGLHNFTFKTVAKIQAELGEKIIMTPNQVIRQIEEEFKKLLENHFSRNAHSEILYTTEKETVQTKVDMEAKTTFTKVIPVQSAKIIGMKEFAKASIMNKPEDQLQPTGT